MLGLLETLAAGYISSSYKSGFAYATTILVLMVIAVPRMPASGALSQVYGRVPLSEILAWPAKRFARCRLTILILGTILAILLPVILDEYTLNVLVLIMIYMIGALGIQLVIGYGGSILVGHAAFVGAGAYASALLSLKMGIFFPLALAGGAIAAALLGLLFAPILRLPGHYCAIATLGFGEIIHLIMVNWVKVTNGVSGLANIPKPRIGPFLLETTCSFFYLTLIVLFLVYEGLRRLLDSRFGRALVAQRENELAATAVGIRVPWARAKAFAIGAACGGIAGGMYAHFTTFISPDSFSIVESIGYLTMIVIGGLGSLSGAIIGALIVAGIPEILRSIEEYRILVYGGLLVAFMMYLPGGVTDLVPRIVKRLMKRRATRPALNGN